MMTLDTKDIVQSCILPRVAAPYKGSLTDHSDANWASSDLKNLLNKLTVPRLNGVLKTYKAEQLPQTLASVVSNILISCRKVYTDLISEANPIEPLVLIGDVTSRHSRRDGEPVLAICETLSGVIIVDKNFENLSLSQQTLLIGHEYSHAQGSVKIGKAANKGNPLYPSIGERYGFAYHGGLKLMESSRFRATKHWGHLFEEVPAIGFSKALADSLGIKTAVLDEHKTFSLSTDVDTDANAEFVAAAMAVSFPDNYLQERESKEGRSWKDHFNSSDKLIEFSVPFIKELVAVNADGSKFSLDHNAVYPAYIALTSAALGISDENQLLQTLLRAHRQTDGERKVSEWSRIINALKSSYGKDGSQFLLSLPTAEYSSLFINLFNAAGNVIPEARLSSHEIRQAVVAGFYDALA